MTKGLNQIIERYDDLQYIRKQTPEICLAT